MSQLNMFDYINGITIGSIAAEMATNIEEFEKPLTAMIIYGIFGFSLSILGCKSIKFRKFLDGTPIVLYNNGKLYNRNLFKAKIDLNSFLFQCRSSGYFNLADLQTIIMEPNGKISFIPISNKRPLTPEDINITPSQEQAVANVIIDGNIMYDNLKHTGNNEQWLMKELKEQKISKLSEVFLATCDSENNLSVYKKHIEKQKNDIFD